LRARVEPREKIELGRMPHSEDARFLIQKLLGRGGFGSVWAAWDRHLGRRVAIKILHPAVAEDPRRRDRFRLGADTMSRLDHPGVIKIIRTVEDDGDPFEFFVMELVDGETLLEAAEHKRLPSSAIIPIIVQVADALEHAHGLKRYHRDVSPTNILLLSKG